MGTRNSTIVISKGKTKVAQYGQWDGYPTGQGQTIAYFLKKVDLDKFIEQVDNLGAYTNEELEQAYRQESDERKEMSPALNRDHGADILNLIHNGVVTKVHIDEDFKEDFKNDGLFCEYYYTIDLDKQTVSMNGGKEYTFKQWTRKGLMEKLEEGD